MKQYPKVAACLLVLVATVAMVAWARSPNAKPKKLRVAEEALAIEGEVRWIELDVSGLFGDAADMNGMSLILETRPEEPTYPHTYQGLKYGYGGPDQPPILLAWYEYRIQDGEWVVEAWNTKGCNIQWRGHPGYNTPPFTCANSICHPADIKRNEWDFDTHDGIGTNWAGAYVAWRGEPHDHTIQTLQLAAGWNLVSLRGDALDASRDVVFPPSKISAVWEYRNPGGYRIPETILPKRGYWIKAEWPTALDIMSNHAGDTAIKLQPGWTLIGVVGPRTVDNMPWQPEPAVDAIWQYAEGGYETPGGVCWEGKGFWIYVEEPTTIWEEIQ